MKKKILTLVGVLGLFAAKVKADNFDYGLGGGVGASIWGYSSKTDTKGAKLSFPGWNAELNGGMNFGTDGEEVAGFYGSLGYEPRSIESEDAKVKVNLQNVIFGVGGRFMPLYFDGGAVYIKGGADAYYSLVIDSEGVLDKKSIKPFNFGPRLEFGVDLLDGGMSVGLGGRLWILNIKDTNEQKALEFKLGSGQVDGRLFIGVNIARLVE